MAPTALVVDDDPVTRLVLCHMLRSRAWAVDEADDAPSAVDRVARTPYDLVISDFHLPSGNGLAVLDAVEHATAAGRGPTGFVLVTGVIEHSSLPDDVTSRLTGQLTKPVSSEALATVLDQLHLTSPE